MVVLLFLLLLFLGVVMAFFFFFLLVCAWHVLVSMAYAFVLIGRLISSSRAVSVHREPAPAFRVYIESPPPHSTQTCSTKHSAYGSTKQNSSCQDYKQTKASVKGSFNGFSCILLSISLIKLLRIVYRFDFKS